MQRLKPLYTGNLNPFIIADYHLNHNLLITTVNRDLQRTKDLLASLEIRASKTPIYKKFYDFVIVNRTSGSAEKPDGSSEDSFTGFSGKIIGNISIKRLSVFGSNIGNPDYYNPNNTVRLLNRTHVNTNENIIRKYLLFHTGDSLSPLTLSDNERLLRNLPYIDDSRILVTPAGGDRVDVTVITKDVYSLGMNLMYNGLDKGSVSVFDKNIFGMGHEFGIEVPWNSRYETSPGFGVNYQINNIISSFANLNLFYFEGLGRKTYGLNLTRNLVSSETKYAGGILVYRMNVYEDYDKPVEPAPVSYTLQDYWIQRSFLINRESVSRIVLGARYTNNNVFDHPFILPETYYNLQQYKLFLGSLSFSKRKFYKSNLIYNYGRTEDIPFGGSFNITGGREINEFKNRSYLGGTLAIGKTFGGIGYLQATAGIGTFFNRGNTEQGVFSIKNNLISRLYDLGNYRIRNFLKAEYTRGFDRYTDEKLFFQKRNGFSGFRNDSIGNAQRLVIGIESVLFSPVNYYGFRFAGFLFADTGVLYGLNEGIANGKFLTSVGIGIRIRNDNLILNTFQIRFSYFPNPPGFSSTEMLIFSGEQLLEPVTFEPLAPSPVPYN